MKDCKHEFKNKLISHGIPWKCNFYIDICEKCRKTKREIFLPEKLEESRKENTELLKKIEQLEIQIKEMRNCLNCAFWDIEQQEKPCLICVENNKWDFDNQLLKAGESGE